MSGAVGPWDGIFGHSVSSRRRLNSTNSLSSKFCDAQRQSRRRPCSSQSNDEAISGPSASGLSFLGGFIVGKVELLDPAIETRSRNPQQFGGTRFVAAGLAQSGLDQAAFDFRQQFVERLDRVR